MRGRGSLRVRSRLNGDSHTAALLHTDEGSRRARQVRLCRGGCLHVPVCVCMYI